MTVQWLKGRMRMIIKTADGSHTIYVPALNEHYHSVNGAIQESRHIFIETGFDYCKSDPLHIFEVGFGTGLNTLLTAIRSINGEMRTSSDRLTMISLPGMKVKRYSIASMIANGNRWSVSAKTSHSER
jgi:tRNA U34 5-methylaminomethyl-2-thiouridine-forming methyltransferase MnmC